MLDTALISDLNDACLDFLADSLAVIGAGQPFEVAMSAVFEPFAEVEAATHVLTGRDSDFGSLRHTDSITVNGTEFIVIRRKSDGLGMSEVWVS